MQIAAIITENKEFWKALIKAGIIDPVWNMRLEIWAEFKALPENKPVMQRYYTIAIKRGISLNTVRRAVRYFEEIN